MTEMTGPQGSEPDHIEVARLARHLWQLAGTPPGRFQEFWNRALEATLAARRQLEANGAVNGAPERGVHAASPPDSPATPEMTAPLIRFVS